MATAHRRFMESINALDRLICDQLDQARAERDSARQEIDAMRDNLRQELLDKALSAADDLSRLAPVQDPDLTPF